MTAENALDARDEFAKREGLENIVIDPVVESRQNVVLAVRVGDEDDGDVSGQRIALD